MAAQPAAGAQPNPNAGLYLSNMRGPSSRELLRIAWQYPVHAAEVARAEAERSRSMEARRALSTEKVFRELAGEDRRPLLVLRECLTCSGTDDALLTRQADNEKTMLLSRWFHCVKLQPDVLEEDHPYHALFAGDDPPHLFVAGWDGQGRLDLNGDQSRTELWGVMAQVISAEYGQRDCKRPLRELGKALDELDSADAETNLLADQLDQAIEKSGPKSSRAKKLAQKLERAEAEKAKARARVAKVHERDMQLARERKAAEAAASVDSGASR